MLFLKPLDKNQNSHLIKWSHTFTFQLWFYDTKLSKKWCSQSSLKHALELSPGVETIPDRKVRSLRVGTGSWRWGQPTGKAAGAHRECLSLFLCPPFFFTLQNIWHHCMTFRCSQFWQNGKLQAACAVCILTGFHAGRVVILPWMASNNPISWVARSKASTSVLSH